MLESRKFLLLKKREIGTVFQSEKMRAKGHFYMEFVYPEKCDVVASNRNQFSSPVPMLGTEAEHLLFLF